jgi:sugar lactone lactonase YvrE
VDRSGNVFVAEGLDCVSKVGLDGIISKIPGGCGGSLSWTISGLAVDSRGNVYVADAGAGRIHRVSPSGSITTIAGGGRSPLIVDGKKATSVSFHEVYGVSVDPRGSVYFFDPNPDRVVKVNNRGVITTVAGGGSSVDARRPTRVPKSAGQIYPWGAMTVDGKGNLYVTDTFQRLLKVAIGT